MSILSADCPVNLHVKALVLQKRQILRSKWSSWSQAKRVEQKLLRFGEVLCLAPHISDLKLHPKLDGLIGNMRIHFVTPNGTVKWFYKMVPPSLKLIYKPIHLSNALNIWLSTQQQHAYTTRKDGIRWWFLACACSKLDPLGWRSRMVKAKLCDANRIDAIVKFLKNDWLVVWNMTGLFSISY